MRRKPLLYACAILALSCAAARAAAPKDLIGTWRLKDFTIQIRDCQPHRLCAKVVAGPHNVGMEVFASRLEVRGDDVLGEVADPETKALYHARLRKVDADRWHLDGCTAGGVCLSAELLRIK